MRILFSALLLLIPLNTFAQELSYSTLYGKWKIVDIPYFVRISSEDYETAKSKWLQAYCIIDSSGVQISHSGFHGCSAEFIRKSDTAIIINGIEPQNSEIWDENYSPTDTTVTDRFISLIDKNYSKRSVLYFKTDCLVDHGDATLRIFVINKNRIALYLDWSMVILERKK